MQPNFVIFLVAGIIPMIVGAIYYNPKVMGTAWMSASGVTEEQAQSGNMLKIFGFAYIFSVFVAFLMYNMTVHQSGLTSLFGTHPDIADPNSEISLMLQDFMSKYGDRHRSFGHGVIHGIMAALFAAWPIIGIVALFERRGWKYTGIHTLYWVISMALMGGLVCAYA